MSLSLRNQTQPPNIQNYLDVRSFLQDYYEWRKTEFSAFSYAYWARELGFQSRTFLRLVVVGARQITERSIPKFQKNLRLNPADETYFLNLVRFTQAPTVEQREYYAKNLKEKKQRIAGPTLIKAHYDFLAHSIGPSVLALLAINNVDWTLARLCNQLNLPKKEVSTCLETLVKLELSAHVAGQTPDTNRWIAKASNFKVPEKIGDFALQSYHRKSLQRAITAIDQTTERRYRSLYVPLSPEEFTEIQEKVQEFVTSILDRYLTDDGNNRRLYQVNISLIPISNPILHSDRVQSAPVGSDNNQTGAQSEN